jgi:hypothetical protein
MFHETKRKAESDCPVCYATHDEEIHEATMRLRGWFRQQVNHSLREEENSTSDTLQARVA